MYNKGRVYFEKNQRASTWSLSAFPNKRYQAGNFYRTYPDLRCDLFQCSSDLDPQVPNLCWVVRAHRVLDVSRNKNSGYVV